jgi:hypothetical protein
LAVETKEIRFAYVQVCKGSLGFPLALIDNIWFAEDLF